MPAQKIAVLGGGLASMTSVFKLTEEENWQAKYDITVYQMGWRLGGKCASGRNKAKQQRIEEHGLHLWFGFYDNAFKLMKDCYARCNWPAGYALPDFDSVFTGHDFICLEEFIDGKWEHWPFTLPADDGQPGDPHSIPGIRQYIYKILLWLKSIHQEYNEDAQDDFGIAGDFNIAGEPQLDVAINYAKQLEVVNAEEESYRDLEVMLTNYKSGLEVQDDGHFATETSHKFRRLIILADLIVTTIRGIISDTVIFRGYKVINKYDFREWLGRHGASASTINSAIVQAVYGLVFGGVNQYTFEAGTALRGLLRLGFTYKGHVYYRMMAGMGDVVFTPFYYLLKQKGVKFAFFHKIKNLKLTQDGKNIAQIEVDVQATVTAGMLNYDPLVEVKKLLCWPSTPHYQQLAEGGALEEQHVDLESYYSTWQAPFTRVLNAGEHFDKVVLGISIGAFPTIAKELIASNDNWKEMVEKIIPIPTIAYQVWLKSTINQMQWPFINKGLALLGSYQEPYDTWADMSDLIIREDWQPNNMPGNIAYFCGPTPEGDAEKIMENARNANFTDAYFPAKQKQVAVIHADDYLRTLTPSLWPGICNANGLDYQQLMHDGNGNDQQRFQWQFFRANIDPTETYVMSFTDSSQYRLKTDENGFDNLYITGDWIDNGFNAGCVEATVMAGLQTARAISGVDFEIPGEDDR